MGKTKACLPELTISRPSSHAPQEGEAGQGSGETGSPPPAEAEGPSGSGGRSSVRGTPGGDCDAATQGSMLYPFFSLAAFLSLKREFFLPLPTPMWGSR